jgi:CRP-like cAMP-binding protein
MKDEKVLWPCELPEPVKNALLRSAQLRTLGPDEHTVFGRGAANGLFYMLRGMVVVGIPNLSKSSPFVVFNAGDWFGGTVIYKDSDFLYRIASIEDSRILFIPDQVIRDAANQHPELYKLLYLITVDHARETVDMLFASSGMQLTQKVAYFLLQVSKRFPRVAGAKPMISMSQTTLAQMLGMSRLTLNQQLHLLEQKNVIAIERKKVYIIDAVLLQAMTAI